MNNIPFEIVKYIDINDVERGFCQLTGWGTTHYGIWHADFNKPVVEIVYPTNANGHVLNGESKYVYYLDEPEDYLNWRYKDLSPSVESLQQFMTNKTFDHQQLGVVNYCEIELTTIICWLMKNDKLAIEGAIYHQEW